MSFINEKVVEEKNCRKCSAIFHVTDKDLEFYKKVSPVFDWKKYQIPNPTLCPKCRKQRRFAYRNENKIYKNTSSISWKETISVYHPESIYKIADVDEWYWDSWSWFDFWTDIDFSTSIFEQVDALIKKIPHIWRYITESSNSDYCNACAHVRDCYLCFNSDRLEKCYYCYTTNSSEKSFDMSFSKNIENSYFWVNLIWCHTTFYCANSEWCSESWFLSNCLNCKSCFMCSNLTNKEYCIENKQYSKEEYLKKKDEILKSNSIKNLYQDFIEFQADFPRRATISKHIQDTTGDNISGVKDSQNIFDSFEVESCKNCWYVFHAKDCMDYDIYGDYSELVYEGIMVGTNAYRALFSIANWNDSNNILYSFMMNACSDCFACAGLKNAQYCILNKQYTKEQYEELVPKIIKHMESLWEWWEFFPVHMSPFGYNETIAHEYFPMSKKEAIKAWYNWADYEAPFPNVEKTIPANKLPENISDIPDDILNWAIECEITKKPFRITKQELDLYRKYNLWIPKKHPDERRLERMQFRNPINCFSRKCDKCKKEIQSSYSEKRKETVYCEECYNKEVY